MYEKCTYIELFVVTALETTQSELFELKNKFEEEGAARYSN